MYSFSEVLEMIKSRFNSIPNVSEDDIAVWVEASYSWHGLDKADIVSPEFASLIMLYAEADGTSQVALRTSHFFEFSDKDESVNKSMISENYRKAAESLWNRYYRKRDEGVDGYGGSTMHYMRRLDRDFDNA